MAKQKEYYRLPGNIGFTMTGRHSLWRGSAHILFLTNRGYTEEYRRFYFTDIQAIYFRKTMTGLILNLIHGIAAFLLAAWAYEGWRVSHWEEWAVVTVFIFAGFFFSLFLINLLLGPTCKTYLRTAVQIQMLSSLRRVRTARKAIRVLNPLIEAAQGTLTLEQLSMVGNAAASPIIPADRRARGTARKATVHEEGKSHLALFGVLILYGVVSLMHIPFQNVVILLLEALLFFGVVVLVVVSMIRQRNSDLSMPLRKMTNWIFGFAMCDFVASYTYSTYSFFGSSGAAGLDGLDLARLFSTKPTDSIPLLILVLFSSSCSLTLGSAGLSLFARMKKQRAAFGRMKDEG